MSDILERISYNVRSAEVVSGVSRSTLYESINDGSLPARKVRGRLIILAEDLHAFVKGGKAGKPNEAA